MIGKEEIAAIQESFFEFLDYVRVISPPTLTNSGGALPYQLWPHIKTAAAALLTNRLIVILKARQIGISYLLAVFSLWFAMTHKGANILMLSKGETEAKALLDKCYIVHRLLPEELHLRVKPDSTEHMGFPAMMSSIKALPATEGAGVGETASIVIADEWDEHPYAQQNFNAIKPTIDEKGGQFIGVFTRRKVDLNTLAKNTFREALDGKGAFLPLFFPWDVVPERDERFYERVKEETPEEELEGLSREIYMHYNYPKSIEEALMPLQTEAAFDLGVVKDMEAEAKARKPIKKAGLDPLICNIWQDYHIGEPYIAASDVGYGIGRDYSVTIIMNARTGVIVSDIVTNTLPEPEFTLHTLKLLENYNNPLWYPESNVGRVVIAKAQELGYANFGYQDAKKTKIGFHTGGTRYDTGSRRDLFGALIPAFNNRQITIYNPIGVRQFYDIIRNKERDFHIEPIPGKHDDYAIAVGICWLKRKEVIRDTVTARVRPYLHFEGERY